MYHTVFNQFTRIEAAQKRFIVYKLLTTQKNIRFDIKSPVILLKKKQRNYLMRRNNPGKKPNDTLIKQSTTCWVEMIHDLVFGAGYSYSRIAYRIKVSPSTIQKLATNLRRKPRYAVLHALLCLHYKVFKGENARPEALAYWNNKKNKK